LITLILKVGNSVLILSMLYGLQDLIFTFWKKYNTTNDINKDNLIMNSEETIESDSEKTLSYEEI
jgi:hypothetical protein